MPSVSPLSTGLFETHVQRARACLAEGKADLAEKELAEGYLLKPRDLTVLSLLGVLYFKQGRLERAEEVFGKLAAGHQPDGAGAAGAEAASEGTRVIVEGPDGALDFFACLRAHRARAVQDVRDGGKTHAGLLGDIAICDHVLLERADRLSAQRIWQRARVSHETRPGIATSLLNT